jgi:hypothetical protein
MSARRGISLLPHLLVQYSWSAVSSGSSKTGFIAVPSSAAQATSFEAGYESLEMVLQLL